MNGPLKQECRSVANIHSTRERGFQTKAGVSVEMEGEHSSRVRKVPSDTERASSSATPQTAFFPIP